MVEKVENQEQVTEQPAVKPKAEVGDYRINPIKDAYDNIGFIVEKCYSIFGGRELWIELDGGLYTSISAAEKRIANRLKELPQPAIFKIKK